MSILARAKPAVRNKRAVTITSYALKIRRKILKPRNLPTLLLKNFIASRPTKSAHPLWRHFLMKDAKYRGGQRGGKGVSMVPTQQGIALHKTQLVSLPYTSSPSTLIVPVGLGSQVLEETYWLLGSIGRHLLCVNMGRRPTSSLDVQTLRGGSGHLQRWSTTPTLRNQ